MCIESIDINQYKYWWFCIIVSSPQPHKQKNQQFSCKITNIKRKVGGRRTLQFNLCSNAYYRWLEMIFKSLNSQQFIHCSVHDRSSVRSKYIYIIILSVRSFVICLNL